MSMPATQLPLRRSIVGRRGFSPSVFGVLPRSLLRPKLQADISGAKESDLLPEPQIE